MEKDQDAPPPPALPPMAPVPQQLDDGISLLAQAFDQAELMGNTLLAAQVGGGMARLRFMLRRVAQLELQQTILHLQLKAEGDRIAELEAQLRSSEIDAGRVEESPPMEPPAPEAVAVPAGEEQATAA